MSVVDNLKLALTDIDRKMSKLTHRRSEIMARLLMEQEEGAVSTDPPVEQGDGQGYGVEWFGDRPININPDAWLEDCLSRLSQYEYNWFDLTPPLYQDLQGHDPDMWQFIREWLQLSEEMGYVVSPFGVKTVTRHDNVLSNASIEPGAKVDMEALEF